MSQLDIRVSILTHLVGWVQPERSVRLDEPFAPDHGVSILTHLVGWVQRASAGRLRASDGDVAFQSSPTWSGGCNHGCNTSTGPYRSNRFQSSPTWSGGCNVQTHDVDPSGSQRDRVGAGSLPSPDRFNPHPPGRVGATGLGGLCSAPISCFRILTCVGGWEGAGVGVGSCWLLCLLGRCFGPVFV